MDIRALHNEADYDRALSRLKLLWDEAPGSPEHAELEVLGILIDAFEEEHHPIDPPDPIAAIRFHMEQASLTQSDLADLLGSPARASEILNKRRALTMDMVRKLHGVWGIPLESLIGEYKLDRSAAE